MTDTPDWLNSAPAQCVAGLLQNAGYQALFVGGCVRNTLLGFPVNDLDLATDALPDQVLALAKNANVKAIPTGKDHGTITLVIGSIPVEVTTFRRDVATDGRRATVAFSQSVADDAARRDFTMNALYMSRDGAVVDPLGGMADLHARKVRFVGDGTERVREDYLRILRFFRFHALYGDPAQGLDAEALAACAAHADGLTQISAERKTSEIMKLLAAPDPGQAVAAMAQSGVLAHVLPGAQTEALFVQLHLEQGETHVLARLAALGGDLSGLRLSGADTALVAQLRDYAVASLSAGAVGYRLGALNGRAALILRAALLEQPLNVAGLQKGADAHFPLKAKDLMPRLSGPALGQALRALEDFWIAQDFQPDRGALIAKSHEL